MKKVGERNGEAVYRIRWRVEGRLVEKWVRGYENARAYKARVETDQAEGAAPDPRAGTQFLNAYFAEWVPARLVKGRRLRQSTRDGYTRLWRRNIEGTIGDANFALFGRTPSANGTTVS